MELAQSLGGPAGSGQAPPPQGPPPAGGSPSPGPSPGNGGFPGGAPSPPGSGPPDLGSLLGGAGPRHAGSAPASGPGIGRSPEQSGGGPALRPAALSEAGAAGQRAESPASGQGSCGWGSGSSGTGREAALYNRYIRNDQGTDTRVPGRGHPAQAGPGRGLPRRLPAGLAPLQGPGSGPPPPGAGASADFPRWGAGILRKLLDRFHPDRISAAETCCSWGCSFSSTGRGADEELLFALGLLLIL